MEVFDVGIIGCGPAGIQAGIYTARKKLKTIIFGKPKNSALYKAHIENLFGLKEKISGKELLKSGLEQLKKFGAFLLEEDVVKIEPQNSGYKLYTENEREFLALAIIIALGIKRGEPVFKDEKKYIGKGVSYCIDCDAWFYKDKDVVVIGDGSAAVDGAKLLSKLARKTYFIPLKSEVLETYKDTLKESQIEIINKKPLKILGEEEVKGMSFEDGSSIDIDGIFIEQGAKGALELVAPLGVELDPETFSYIKVDKKQRTNIEGIFACGDITGPPLQLAKAIGEACVAAFSVAEYLKKFQK